MVILGIDPALTKLGWGIISVEAAKLNYLASGIIKTTAKELIHKRLANITCQLQAVIKQYQPAVVAMEETFINSNNASSLKLGYVRGAIMSLVGSYDGHFYEFTPNTIKKTVVGAGHAEKEQVAKMVKILLPATTAIKFDETDALAIAYTCAVYLNIS